MAKRIGNRVTTNEVRLSYVKVWEKDEHDKYGCTVLIPKSDTETIDLVKEAIESAKVAGKDKKFGGKIPAKLRISLRDADAEEEADVLEKNPAYAGHLFMNASSRDEIKAVDQSLMPITERSDLYSGCYAQVVLDFYPYAVDGNKGVAAGLKAIKKTRDGEAFGGAAPIKVEDFFDADAAEDLF